MYKKPQHAHDAHDLHHHNQAVNPFGLPLLMIVTFAIFEGVTGHFTQSLALVSDAWHMGTDSISLALAWLGVYLGQKPGAKKHASGTSYAEIIAGGINVVLMVFVIILLAIEAVNRIKNPAPVVGSTVFWVASAGLLINLIVMRLMHHAHTDDSENTNSHAAYLHVLGDLLGSAVAIVAGAVIYFTGWYAIDPILTLVITLLLAAMTAQFAFAFIKMLSSQKA